MAAQSSLDQFRTSIDSVVDTYFRLPANTGYRTPSGMLNEPIKTFYDSLLSNLRKTGQSDGDMQRAIGEAHGYVAEKLRPTGEGYTALINIGAEDPFAILGISAQDYITHKAKEVKTMVSSPETCLAGAFEYHLDEIIAVGKRYGIDTSQTVKPLVAAFMEKFAEKSATEIKTSIGRCIHGFDESGVETLERIGKKYGGDATPYTK